MTVAHTMACLFVISIWFCIPEMYAFNELQQEGLGAATLRQALITSIGCLNSSGQPVTTMYSQSHFQDYPREINEKYNMIQLSTFVNFAGR